MGDLQMLPLHTKVTWTGRGDMSQLNTAEHGGGPKRGGVVGGRCHGVPMTTTTQPAAGADTPEALEARFVALASAGDLDGIVGLYAADAVVSLPQGREAAGPAAIRAAFAAALAAGALGPLGPLDPLGEAAVVSRAIVTGDLAMTTSSAADGSVRTQVARRTAEGRWVWVRDGSRLRDVPACVPAGPGSLAVA